MAIRSWSGLLFSLLAIEIAALLLFTHGFFPKKTYLPRRATPVEDVPEWPGHPPLTACETLRTKQDEPLRNYTLLDECFGIKPQFDRLIFMVVDALRNDFAFGPDSEMEFTKQTISNRHAVPFIGRATTPTVTLPRIKALSTGMVPNFQDAILNIVESGKSKTTEDNWLMQLRENRGKKLIFYGDETWLNFATPAFSRYEGTSSFYVTDTVEVDTNVTRHVGPELANKDWDVMVLHYLGLDHIGHSAGPKSPLMKPKQREMDGIVRLIYDKTKETDEERIKADPHALPTLIILCGDHGMNELGGHGGSSPGETSPALIFMSPSVQWSNITIPARTINQIDVVPTIASLFGVPAPRNSLGNLVPEMFQSLPHDEWIRALQLNANQIRSMLISLWGSWDTSSLKGYDMATINCDDDIKGKNEYLICTYEQAIYQHQHISNRDQKDLIEQVTHLYRKFAEQGAQQLTQNFSTYGMGSMTSGIIIMIITTFVSLFFFLRLVYQQLRTATDAKPSIASLTRVVRESLVCQNSCLLALAVILLIIVYGVELLSTSYIGEEQQTWYYIMQTTWLLQILLWWPSINGSKHLKLITYPLLQMVFVRILRMWDQSGHDGTEMNIRNHLDNGHTDLRRFLMVISTIIACGWGLYITLARRRQYSLAAIRNIAITTTITITGCMVIFYKLAYEVESHPDMPAAVGHWMLDHVGKLALARLAYLGIFTLLMMASFWPNDASQQQTRTSDRHQLYLVATTLLLILLARIHNPFVFILFGGQLYALIKHVRCLKTISEQDGQSNTGLSIIMYTVQLGIPIFSLQQVAFYALGNTNALSSVELNSAYTGVSTFIPAIVGVLAFICNWAGPIWWALAGMVALSVIVESDYDDQPYQLLSTVSPKPIGGDNNNNNNVISPDLESAASALQNSQDTTDNTDKWSQSIALWLWMNKLLFSFILASMSIVATLQRYHLFVWWVFSPKYIYQAAWVIFHIIVSCWMMYFGRILPISLPKKFCLKRN
ncbi:hypothetical protein BDF19DRAFT_439308 [Syncephalis fuscata]|nr:hypothetical protein BDF19DRAFT_439308 [Syncephalis fuscata]